MNFLKKIFGKDPKPNFEPAVQGDPHNAVLVELLHRWQNNESSENYTMVINELMTGNSFLLLPSVNDSEESRSWKTLKEGATLKLTSVFRHGRIAGGLCIFR
jgi:hypothetical protein